MYKDEMWGYLKKQLRFEIAKYNLSVLITM